MLFVFSRTISYHEDYRIEKGAHMKFDVDRHLAFAGRFDQERCPALKANARQAIKSPTSLKFKVGRSNVARRSARYSRRW